MSSTRNAAAIAVFALALASSVPACPPPPPPQSVDAAHTKPAAPALDMRIYAKALDMRRGHSQSGVPATPADYTNVKAAQPDTASQTAAQGDAPKPQPDATPWLAGLVPAPNTPEAQALAQAHKSRLQQEKDLRKLRAQYFRASHNTEVRQVGILKLREYTDPAIFPSLLSLFQGEGRDVENAVLDHLRDLKTDEADASLSWAAVFGKEKPFRDAATTRLIARTKEAGSVSNRIKWPISLGLRDNANATVVAGAQLAQALRLYDAIPMLINAQVTQSAGQTRADDGGDPALAYILVGTQVAYVANLTPIVGDSAVGFNPQLGVLTEGVVLRVIDAIVITYRVEVNQALIGLSTQGWGGQSTAQLGWDQKAWRDWYARDFVPFRKKADAELAAGASKPVTLP